MAGGDVELLMSLRCRTDAEPRGKAAPLQPVGCNTETRQPAQLWGWALSPLTAELMALRMMLSVACRRASK